MTVSSVNLALLFVVLVLAPSTAAPKRPPSPAPADYGLTPREIAVLRLLVDAS